MNIAKQYFWIILIVVTACFSEHLSAQVLSNKFVTNGVGGENPFFDASTYFDYNFDPTSAGKGFVFPRTDLTHWSFLTSMLDGATFPGAFDGMIVYNFVTGNTPTTDSNPDTSTHVTPGFYYFSNPAGADDASITHGRWLRMSDNLSTSIPQGNVLPPTTNPTPTVGNLFYLVDKGIQVFNGTTWIPITKYSTNTLMGASWKFTSTVNGVIADFVPASGVIVKTLGFDATGNLVNQNGSAAYIQNQNSAAQSANMWINGTVTAGTGVFNNITVNGILTAPSDIRLKTKIETLTNVLAKLEQVRGVSYEFKDQQKYAKGPQVGVIAQELQKVFPELVRTDANGSLSVNYSQLTGVLIQAVKEQQQEIDLLKTQMAKVMKKLGVE